MRPCIPIVMRGQHSRLSENEREDQLNTEGFQRASCFRTERCNVWEPWDLAMQLSDLKSWRKTFIFFIFQRPGHVVHRRQEEEWIHTYQSRRILAELATLSLEYVLGTQPNKLSATEFVYSSETDAHRISHFTSRVLF